MCVTFLALFNEKEAFLGGKYKLVILNNRDETFDRRTSGLHWDGDLLAGRDEDAEENGTWLGINRRGDIGNLLSITEPAAVKAERGAVPSRGRIVNDFLQSDCTVQNFCDQLASESERYHGFQFLGLKRLYNGKYEFSSVTNRIVPNVLVQQWKSGVYGFGNSPTTHPLKKVSYGEKRFREILNEFDFAGRTEEEFIESLLELATDSTSHYPDEQLRHQTGLPDHQYRSLCSLFVRFLSIRYGTRSHSVILIDNADNVTFFEKRMTSFPEDISTAQWETTVERFQLGAP